MNEEELKKPVVQVIHSGWFAILAYLLAGVSLVLACDARLRIAQESDRNAVCYMESKQYADQLSTCYAERMVTRDEMKAMWYYIKAKTGSIE
jgi:hypothetical protein